MISPRELLAMYERGENISAALRKDAGSGTNTEEIIEWAYDIQAGSYIRAMGKPEIAAHKQAYAGEIARIVGSLGPCNSILEAGVGEATTLGLVLSSLAHAELSAYGFDLSWSRTICGQRWLQQNQLPEATLCTGSLLNIPFASDSIDIVYTSHSIEPNAGQEEPILRELHRVTRRYLILLEPGYELATEEARQRMEAHGYCRHLKATCESLGYKVLEHRAFPFVANPLNPTALTIIEKGSRAAAPREVFVCPRFKTALRQVDGFLFSAEALTVYPIIGGIPCLRVENGVVASRFLEFFQPELSP